MTSIEEQIALERIRRLEEATITLSSDMTNMANSIREMQQIIVKVATNQQQMATRIADWPFIKVEPKKKPKGDL